MEMRDMSKTLDEVLEVKRLVNQNQNQNQNQNHQKKEHIPHHINRDQDLQAW